MKLVLLTFVIMNFISCKNMNSAQAENAKDFKVLEDEIKTKFGENSYYTEITIAPIKGIGNIIDLTVAVEPESLTMASWNFSNGDWKQTEEITIELPKGTEAKDFMFQLGSSINLSKLGEVVEKSIEELKESKKIEKPAVDLAFIKFPENGDISKAEYVVNLKPENGGTTFNFSYDLDGKLTNFDY